VEQVSISQAKAQFSRLVKRAIAGEEIVIAKKGKPVARLVALESDVSPRAFGTMRGKFWIADDFDDPLPPEILARFYGDE
jgi:prevent-host-death family protein